MYGVNSRHGKADILIYIYIYKYLVIYIYIVILIKKILSLQLRKVIFQFSMETDTFDIDRYVPFKCLEDIEIFCDSSDGMLLKRKDALAKRIFAASDTSSLTNFVGSVATALFDIDFIRTHKWPTQK